MTTRSKSIITKEYLLDLFESEETYIIEPNIKIADKSTKSYKSDTSLYMFTPKTQQLLDSYTPETKRYMIDDFLRDDVEIYNIEQRLEAKDELYEYFENTAVGIFLEEWICCYLRCNCGDRFVKYQNPNMPVIDIKCNNPIHNIDLHGPKYYQIKSSELHKTYKGYEYFQLNPYQYIHVGSPTYGKICHEIKINDIEKSNHDIEKRYYNKHLLIGYICIKYTYNSDNNITINKKESFILQPNLHLDETIDKNLQYYEYVDTYIKKPVITFKPYLFNIFLFEQIQLKLDNVSITQFIRKINIVPNRLLFN